MEKRIYKVCSLLMAVVLCISFLGQSSFAAVIIKTGQVSLDELKFICKNCNENPFDDDTYDIVPDSSVGRFRIKNITLGAWYVDSKGAYAYVPMEGDVPADGPGNAPADVPATPSISKNKFVDARAVSWDKRAISTKSALGELVVNLGKEGINSTLAKNNVPKGDGSGKYVEVWCVMNANKIPPRSQQARSGIMCYSSFSASAFA